MSPKTTLYKRSDIEALPLELREEILSHLDFPSIKCLSLTSSILRAVCFRRIFRALYLRGIVTTFLEDLKGQAPMACFHTIKIEGLQQDVSTDLHPWCSKVHTVKIKDANIGNTTILPSLTILKDLDLSDLTFSAVDDYFKLLANLPPTLKKLTVRGIEFKYHQSEPIVDNIVGRGAALEHLETDSAEDLTLLLKDHCPISLKSLRVANVPQARPHDLEVLVQTAPHLIDLRLDISTPEDRPVSLPLTRLKLLSITDRTESVEAIIQLLSSPSDVPSALQVLSFSFPFNQVMIMGEFRSLLLQPKFRNLKGLNLQLMRQDHFFDHHRLWLYSEQVRIFQHRLEQLGMIRDIDFKTKIVMDPKASSIMRRFL